MNCKPGDLAFVVQSMFPGNIGSVVLVIAPGQTYPERGDGRYTWHCKPQGTRTFLCEFEDGVFPLDEFDDSCDIADADLRPIRNEPGTDEILRIAGHPLSQSHRERHPA